MRVTWNGRLVAAALALAAAMAASATTSGQKIDWGGVLDQHPAIQYATRPTTDRVVALNRQLADGTRSLVRDPRTGYLSATLAALGVPADSQLLVFSKTGVQRALVSPQHPRALYFDESVVVGYIPGAPVLEIAAHDPQQGVVFYTLDQSAASPAFRRAGVCLSCHVTASTLDVPGLIVRSNAVADDGGPLPQLGSNDVDHRTGHADRWGGWFVTSAGAPPPYSQRAHAGNITSTERGQTSNGVFVDWIDGAPEAQGYLSGSSDITALLAFDHQSRAINLLTRLNWEARIAQSDPANASEASVRGLAEELGDYLLFVREAPFAAALTADPAFAARLEARTPKDRQGRSFGQIDLTRRLLRYPCSYMIYAPAFDGLPAPIRQAVYRRMVATLSASDPGRDFPQLTAADRRAILEILRETKPDFPAE